MTALRVGGIVLCGGQSKRMGRPKAWLPVGEELMLPRVVRLLGEAVGTISPDVATARTTLPLLPTHDAAHGPHIDYELILDCVHCGLCTASCPTYVETGNEADSPRGRIYLMRQVIDGALKLDEDVKHHLDLCLNCRACETACPSGVQYGKLIEPFRVFMAEGEPGRQVQCVVSRLAIHRDSYCFA